MSNEDLVKLIQEGKDEYIEQLWTQTEKFIWMMAGRRVGNNTDIQQEREDLYQVGYFALLNAVKGFKEGPEGSFINYLSFHLKKQFNEVLGNVTVAQKKEPIKNAIRLDSPIESDDGDEMRLSDIIPDQSAEEAFNQVAEADRESKIKNFVNKGIQTMTEHQQVFFYELLKHDLNRAKTQRSMGITRSNGYSHYTNGSRKLRTYMSLHLKELEELEILESRSYASTGLNAFKNRIFTSQTESLALKSVERSERLKQLKAEKAERDRILRERIEQMFSDHDERQRAVREKLGISEPI